MKLVYESPVTNIVVIQPVESYSWDKTYGTTHLLSCFSQDDCLVSQEENLASRDESLVLRESTKQNFLE